jgi:hypothetical protein
MIIMRTEPGANPELPFNSEDPEALRRVLAMKEVVNTFLTPEDGEVMGGMVDEAELIGYAYGRLLEEGCDPDEVLREAGVIES